MSNWKDLLISPTVPILKAVEIIDTVGLQIALVVDSDMRLLGTITDGDIRRGLLKKLSLEEPVDRVMNCNPTTTLHGSTREAILAQMKQKKINQIPVVDESRKIVGLEVLKDLLQPGKRPNRVLLMAGGLGSRLMPLTNDCPKPMLKVGGKPVLESIIEAFVAQGFHRFDISVNYKAEMIMDYFQDGSKFGAEIRYIRESQRMGTAGALGLVPEQIQHPMIVMNADLVTRVNFQQLLDFHLEHEAKATMGVRQYEFQVPYGVVSIESQRFEGIDEKPIHQFFVNAGIYVFSPEVIDLVEKGAVFDIPELFERIRARNLETAVFPIREYWVDIGKFEDLQRANEQAGDVGP